MERLRQMVPEYGAGVDMGRRMGKVKHNKFDVLQLKELTHEDARELLLFHAEGGEGHVIADEQVIMGVVNACGYLPLTLEVIGRLLRSHIDALRVLHGSRLPESDIGRCFQAVLGKLASANEGGGTVEDKLNRCLYLGYDALQEGDKVRSVSILRRGASHVTLL